MGRPGHLTFAVRAWLRDAWPFTEVRYAPRPAGGGGNPGMGT